MNWDAIGAIGEVVGATAVIITLAYLATQIRQNTQSVRSAALDNSITAITASRRAIVESAELTNIWNRGLNDHTELDADELLRFRLAFQDLFWGVWNIYAQSELTGLSQGVWDAQKPLIERVLTTPGGAWFWTNYKREFEQSFVTEIERVVREDSNVVE